MPFQFRQGDSGFLLRLRFQENAVTISIATATTKDFILIDPRGISKRRPGTFTSDGSDGLLQYRVEPGDFDQAGRWRVQGHVVIPQSSLPDLDCYSAAVETTVDPTFGRDSA